MSESQKAGKILEFPHKETLSDGTAGGVEQGSVSLNMLYFSGNCLILISDMQSNLVFRR